MNEKILIVEDSDAESISRMLQFEGYATLIAVNGEEALGTLEKEKPDLMLLDLMLPRMNGYEVLQRVRAMSDIPVVIISACCENTEVVRGYDLGADAYMSKPLEFFELLAIIRMLFRRKESLQAAGRIHLGNVEIDWERAEVFRDGEKILLTAKEFGILKVLYEKRSRVLSREQLLDAVWGIDFYGDARVVDATIKRLRKKVGAGLVETVRGLGYRLMNPNTVGQKKTGTRKAGYE